VSQGKSFLKRWNLNFDFRQDDSLVSRFSISSAHAHWVGSLDTPSHAIKGKKCANGTGSLITPLIDF